MKKSKHQQRIEEFMGKAGQEIPDKPCIPNEEIRLLRAKLILEEALETIEALGFLIRAKGDPDHLLGLLRHDLVAFDNVEPNLLEIADGCADISVVTIGTLSACGISDKPLLEEIDKSNLAKFEEGSYKREDGKWMKPPNWQPPNIEAILEQQKKSD